MYKTSEQVATQFKKDLAKLLKKYNTEIEVVDNGYGYHIDEIMEVYIPGVYDKDGNCVAESAEIKLGKNVDANL